MNINYEKVEEKIRKCILDIPSKIGPGKGDGEWTKSIKDTVGKLGNDLGYHVCATGFTDKYDHFCGEWLYDLVWYKNYTNNDEDYLEDILLVLECEWNKNRKEIKYDFEKLLISKSYFKVMVFQSSNDEIDDIFSKLEEGEEAYKNRTQNEKYMIFGLKNYNNYSEFVYKPL